MNSVEIAGSLRRQIVAARYQLNERLPPERSLADQFDVARGTVREALRQLEGLGFVERRAGSGTYVTYSGEDKGGSVVQSTRPLELIDARFAIEPHMVRLAVLHATESDLERVEAHLRRMETCDRDAGVFAEADEAFHRQLAECTGNPMIIWMMEKMHEVRSHSQWAQMRVITLTPEIIDIYNTQHRAVVDAIRARDAEHAANAMKAHLSTARQSLIDAAS